MRRPDRDFDRLAAQLAEIDSLLEGGEERLGRRAPRVSGWSVAQQIDHLLKVLSGALGRLQAPGEPLAAGINWTGRLLLGVGRLPRGVAQAPRATAGLERSGAELRSAADEVRERLAEVRAGGAVLVDRRPRVRHPYFGGLSALQAIRFLAVHTDHHLRIVREILRATGAGG